MNNRRGALLVLSVLIIAVLGILLFSFFFKAVGENEMALQYGHSSRALWLAETGIAQVVGGAGLVSRSGIVDDPNYTYNAVVSNIAGNYYRVVSTGTVSLSSGKTVSRVAEATVKTGAIDPTKFKYGIETTTDLVMKGAVDIHPSDSWHEFATLDFADLFGVTKAEMKANAHHVYNDASFTVPIDGITWVDVTVGSELTIAGNLQVPQNPGDPPCILIINGDAHISGTVDFKGIIYVIGELTMTGTVLTSGAVLAESDTTVDTELKGTVDIYYEPSDIAAALGWVSYISKEVVAWKEL